MKKNNESLDLYNLKGTISREILNYQEYNNKGKFGLQFYATIVNFAGSLYMVYNDILDNALTLTVKNGITAFSCYELFLIINDIKKKKKSEEVLNELLKKINLDEKIENLIPLVLNDDEINENIIVFNEECFIREYIEDGLYKCNYIYKDGELEITNDVNNLTGGVKKLKTK